MEGKQGATRVARPVTFGPTVGWAAMWFVLASTLLAAQANGFPDEAAMQRELQAFVEEHRGAPGVVVGLLDPDGRRVHAFGASGRPGRPQVDGDTRFEIGSITKTFTGILLADMLLAGEVSAGQRVATLFPRAIALDNGVQNATLEELATHASGLPRIAVDLPALARTMSIDPYRGTTADDVYRSAARVPSALVRPTETQGYSNLGYALLGRLLELHSGRAYEELLRHRVLGPLGLASIAIGHDEPQPLEMAQGHGPGGRPTSYWHVDGYAPAGGLIASADELLAYVAINLAASNPAVAEAQRQRRVLPGGRGVGLGWQHAEVGGRRLIWHNGITGGFRSFVGFLPDEGRGLVVLANGQGDVDALARRLLDSAEPPLPRSGANALTGIAITLLLLAWGPLAILSTIRRAGKETRRASVAAPQLDAIPDAGAPVPAPPSVPATVDRLDVLRSPLTPAIALLLASRLGAWHDVPYAAWWGAVAIAVVAFAVLVLQARALPWFRKGARRALGRGLMTALEVAVLAALFS